MRSAGCAPSEARPASPRGGGGEIPEPRRDHLLPLKDEAGAARSSTAGRWTRRRVPGARVSPHPRLRSEAVSRRPVPGIPGECGGRRPARGGAAQRAGGCRSPWPRGSQTDPAQPPPADRIQRQGRVVGNREASLLPRGPRKTASQTVSEVPKTPLGLNEDSVRRGWGVRAGGQGRPG